MSEFLENFVGDLFCPFCGKKMMRDVHLDPPFPEIDNWVCLDCPALSDGKHGVLIERDDLESIFID